MLKSQVRTNVRKSSHYVRIVSRKHDIYIILIYYKQFSIFTLLHENLFLPATLLKMDDKATLKILADSTRDQNKSVHIFSTATVVLPT
jgi:hypothetical protein